MPASPRMLASSAPKLAQADAMKLEKAPLALPAGAKSLKKKKKRAESALGSVEFAVPTESSSKLECTPKAEESVRTTKGAKRRARLAREADEQKFAPKDSTPAHLVGSKVANLFADMVPVLEKPASDLQKSVSAQQVAAGASVAKVPAMVTSKETAEKARGRVEASREAKNQPSSMPAVETSKEAPVLRKKKKGLKRKAPVAPAVEGSLEEPKKKQAVAEALPDCFGQFAKEEEPPKKQVREVAQSKSAEELKKQQIIDESKIVKLGSTAYCAEHTVSIKGVRVTPFETFKDCARDFGEPIMEALRLQGYAGPTPIQALAWPIALRGQDMVAVAKTGSGKTCGFLLPALTRLRQFGAMVVPKRGEPCMPKVLVVAPTRELAQQIAGEADKFAHVADSRAVAIYGGVPKGDQVRDLERGADIVIATPGRLMDFSVGKPEKYQGPMISMKQVSYLVLDEADRMLDMGFEPDIRKIIAACPPSRPFGETDAGLDLSGSVRQTLFFTATWPKAVERTAASLTAPGAVQLRIGQAGQNGDKLTANTSVTQKVMVVDEKQKLTHLKEIIEKELGPGETAFIFAKTRHTCDYLEGKLWDEKEDLMIGTWCRTIHSHKEQWIRDESLATFRSITMGKDNGRKGILVATDVAARGLDIPGVALVVVYDFGGGNLGENSGVESYVHRIGRTGRAGKTGRAFTFFTEHDTGARKLVELLTEAKQRVPYELQHLADKSKGGKGGKSGKGGKGGKGSNGGKGGKGGKGGGGGGKGDKGGGKGGKFGSVGKGGKFGKGKGGGGGKGGKGGKW